MPLFSHILTLNSMFYSLKYGEYSVLELLQVCRRWYSILSAPGFWINYMIYRSLDLPPSFLRSEPSLNVKKVSIKQAFRRNLISNPSGDDGSFESWEIGEYGGDG